MVGFLKQLTITETTTAHKLFENIVGAVLDSHHYHNYV